MTSTLAQSTASDAPSVAATAGDLATALERLTDADRAMAEAVTALSRTIGTGVAETVEGLPLDLVLANLCRLTRSDRSTLITAADVLRTLPATARLWLDGELSWGQVRIIVARATRLPVAHRQVLDRRVEASRAAHDGLDGYGPDGLVEAIDRAADELDGLATLRRREQRTERSEFLSLQLSLDGGLRGYFELGPVAGATVANAIHTHRPAHDPKVKRGKRLADGLTAMAARSLDGGGRAAKPLIDVIVDTTQTTVTAAGTIDLKAPGHLPTLTARIIEDLNRDATLRITLMDGKRPLATGRRRHAKDTPASVKHAVALRDKGDRTPGSQAPTAWCDTHHLIERGHGGDHDPDNLITLASGHHQRLHRHRWRYRLDPHTGEFTIARDGRVYRSLPRGSPLAPDPGPAPVIHYDPNGVPLPF